MTGRILLRDGLRLRIDEGDGTGVPVVFQHGLCGDARQTEEAFPDDPRFRRLTLECRGHGGSQAGDPAAFSIATFAEDVAALVEGEGQGPVVLGGISMGAAIALLLAVRRPDLVRGLILARPAWVTAAAPANMAPNAEVGRLLASLPAAEARRIFLAGPTADGPGVSEADLRGLRVPALVVGHGRDAVHPLAHAEALAALIPGARLVRITPKAEDRDRHLADLRHALASFLEDFA